MPHSPKTNILGVLSRAEDRLLAALGWLLIVLLAGMVVVVSLQVASRYLLNVSLIWSEEVARLFFISLVFVGTAVLARQRNHLTVTIFVDMLPDRTRHLADAAATGVGLICSYFLVHGAWATLLREWDQRTPALQFPMGVVFALILASCALLLLWLVVTMIASLADAARGAPHDRKGPETGPEDAP
ncbi:TRAP transporter small permease [Ahrensia marina]|uniref:TRAP transporter small permease n=1 Tax=Ahrensia marina TaxID=1514904 RepID=UPI0035CED554